MKYVSVVAFGLALAGCASVGGSTISQVQAYTQTACAFLPTAETIAAILAKNNSALGTATAIADAICAAVGPATGAVATKGLPRVAGVVVSGTRVRP